MELSYKTVGAILERWQREGIVTDHCSEYGEPGYGSYLTPGATPLVVLGNYWCECGRGHATSVGNLHAHEDHHPLLWAQLEAQGVSFEWYDEWVVDYENDKAYRTSPDSYSWQPSTVFTDGGELLTPDDDLDVWLEWAIEDPASRCLLSNIHSANDVLGAGFERWNGQFEHGWHPGQTDDPSVIAQEIHTALGDAVEVVFLLDSTGQFDVAFSAYYRKGSDQ